MTKKQMLISKHFNGAYTYNIEQLSRYNDFDGKRVWGIAFESLNKTISELKLKHEADFKNHFLYLELALLKIKELGQQPNSVNNEELNLYIDYFKLKTLSLLEEINALNNE